MNIAIGADHRGYPFKNYIKNRFDDINWNDVGCFSESRSDYPIFARSVSILLLKKKVDLGILICATGVGMAIAANRNKGIFAAVVWNKKIARLSREDDNSNILVLPADFILKENLVEIIKTWLNSKFKGGIYEKRINMIDAYL